MGKKILKILAGLGLVLVSVGTLPKTDPWLIVGLFFLLAGLAPFLCKCDACTGGCCMDEKKKK